MAEEDRISQHLEMMIHKRSRCEDWVASVASRKQNKKTEEKKEKYEFDFNDELSDLTETNESVKRRLRKTVNPRKLPLTFVCEWNSCTFTSESERTTFFTHVSGHVQNLTIVKKSEDSECYQCSWESCNFQSANTSEIKRHINYHAYHTILKAAASKLHNLWDFPHCKLDGENRNWLPDLSYPFECCYGDCDFTSDNIHIFLNHVNNHILEIQFDPKKNKNISCSWRGCLNFKCRSKTRLKIHLKKHTGEKTLACPTCGALFATNTKYMDHCVRKTPDKIECNRCQYCLRYFASERLLRDHMRYHINSYKCSFCEMTCSTPATLANHVRYRHLDEKPYKCTECSFTSKSAEDCNAHMTTHDAEPRFQCEADNCDFVCRSMATFKKHFKSVHLMESGPIYCCHLCNKKYNRGPCLGEHLRNKHKLEHPPGHTRFRYMENIDGFYRLQVERYESLELNDVEVSITHINEQSKNYVLKQDTSGDKNCKKFTLCVEEPQNRSNKGAFIAIDEIDEDGNVIRTSTVQEELIQKPNEEILFVDVNDQDTAIENQNNSEKVSAINTSNGANQIRENFTSVKDCFSSFVFVDVNDSEIEENNTNICSQQECFDINFKNDKNINLVNNNSNIKNVKFMTSRRNVKLSDCENHVEIIVKRD